MKLQKNINTNSIQVANILRDAIINGDLYPGLKLREVEISKELSVSRTPIREAFRILESEGLLEVSPNRGVKVISLSEHDIQEIYELRELIEVFAINKACANLTEKEINLFEEIVHEMDECIQRNNYKEYLRCSTEFHLVYIMMCDNKRIIEVYQKIWNNILATQILAMSDVKQREKTMKDHTEILAALKKRDKSLSEKLVRKHIAAGLTVAKTRISKNNTPHSH